ncbi:hypothetical protein [Lactococcus termiticola]|uniref:Uncharacterized protein n=1 Tax=Lactococcus termiticola TaxID=2169526 RepID=A0A2R5HGB3_9LACT|nr:hypothetical protein [Lactococcus termiticola]GBG97103.1 hypothetical protein NtB2_01240 [Lactococcus termiticola]
METLKSYQVMYTNAPLLTEFSLKGMADAVTLASFHRHEGSFRVKAVDLAAAEKFAGQELARRFHSEPWASEVHFTVRGKELSRFEKKPWLDLSPFLAGNFKDELSDPAIASAKLDKIVLSILAVTFSGLSLLLSFLPFGGLFFALIGLVFVLLAWLKKHNRTLLLIAVVPLVLGTIISFILTGIFVESI